MNGWKRRFDEIHAAGFSRCAGLSTRSLVIENNTLLRVILEILEKMMPTLDDILKDVTDESTDLDSLSTLVAGLKQQVADALANTGLSTADQAKVAAIFAQVEANRGKVNTALNANVAVPAPTPPATPPDAGSTPAPAPAT